MEWKRRKMDVQCAMQPDILRGAHKKKNERNTADWEIQPALSRLKASIIGGSSSVDAL